MLVEAKAHPERHPDLVVRVSGYSAYFSTLPEAVQDEINERTLQTFGKC
jgi:formate C-acetyltransferase